jgi:RNA polymerase sigma-70 factor (ECF subfamily)
MSASEEVLSDEGREEQFAELFSAHQQRLFGYIVALVRNTNDAHDILQQAAIAMWKKFPEFELGTDFGRWAITVARFETLNFLKYRRRNRVVFSQELVEQLGDDFSEMDNQHLGARRDALRSCLTKLPSKDRKLIECRYTHGLNSRQIAELQERSQASICNSLRRIREGLLRCIELTISMESRV